MPVEGVKHLIECHCVLPQYRKMENPIFHKFVVFSVIDDDVVEPKFVQCNNCSIVHKITDICKSEIVAGLEFSNAVTRIDEVRESLPDQIASFLEKANADMATWENVAFLLENSLGGFEAPIAKEIVGGMTQVKMLSVDEKGKVKIKTVTRNDDLEIKNESRSN